MESCSKKIWSLLEGLIRLSCSLPPGNDGGSIPPYPVLTIERQQNLWLSLATPLTDQRDDVPLIACPHLG